MAIEYKVCTAGDCGREARARGFCNLHYQRWRNTGVTDDPRPTWYERVEAKVGWGEWDECWPWQAARNWNGYGVIQIENALRSAHIVMYELCNGPVPTGLVLDHTCHNIDLSCKGGRSCPHRGCVNPSHLEPVTSTENLRRSRVGRSYKVLSTSDNGNKRRQKNVR